MLTKDAPKWKIGVKEEYEKLVKHGVFKLVKRNEVPSDAKILTSTWVMKKKSNGTFRARINGRGYEQVDGEHYDSDSVASPTINIVSVRVILVLLLLMRGYAHLVDVHGAFLLEGFEHDLITNKKRKIYMKIPPAFYEFLPKWCRPFCEWLMELLNTLYGTKQAAKHFWLLLLSIMKSMGFKYNRVDPCLYYKWTDEGLKIWASWVDDCLHIGASKESVLKSKDILTNELECDDNGEMKKYVGVKMDYDKENQMLKMTQPVLLQSFKDEFELPTENFNTPASPGSTLQLVEDGETIGKEEQSKYRSGVGKLLHMMRWSRPDILNAVRETSRFMGEANPAHEKAMLRILKYCTNLQIDKLF
jgi:hypothetical protein